MALANLIDNMYIYQHDDVEVQTSGHHKSEEAAYKGKICMEEKHGIIMMEWLPEEQISGLPRSPDNEISEWEDLTNSPTVGYSNSSEVVEIKASTKKKLKTSVEVNDLRSYRLQNGRKRNHLTFHLRDGTTLPTFHFPNKDQQCLINALRKYVSFKKSSRDESLYVAIDPKHDALQKSFNELQLYDDKGDIVTKFFHDPYTVTMDGFSKVTNAFRDYLFYGKVPLTCTDEEMAEFLSLPSISPQMIEAPTCNINTTTIQEDFEVITCLDLPPRPLVKRLSPLSMEEWNAHLEADGRIKNVPALKYKIFRGGVDPSLRCEVWKFLLGFYDFESSMKEREAYRKSRIDDYYRMKLQWKSFTKEQEDNFIALRDRKNLVEKDVGRTDRNHPFYSGEDNCHLTMLHDVLMTYCMYNFDLGYVQGMSDLLSPLLVVNQNEPDVFWCFAGFVKKVGSNFEMDQQGMKNQLEHLRILIHHWDPPFSDYLEAHDSGNLYFFFRWLLIIFKREFKFEDVMRLWEVLWTDLPCKNFHLLVCLSILDPEKNTIVESNFGLTEILKHVNDMSFKVDLEETLCRAEGMYLQFAACRNLPKELAEILGLPVQEAEEVSFNKGVTKVKTMESKDRVKLESASPKSSSSVDSIEASLIDVGEDLDAKFQIPFSLFT